MKKPFTEKIKEARKVKKISQEEMAKILNIPRSTYAYKEKTNNFSQNEITEMCSFLEISLEDEEKPYTPFGIINENENQLVFESPILRLPNQTDDSKQIFATNAEVKNLKRIRLLGEEKTARLLEFLEKLENDEI